jgi:hypothetical protein
MDDASLLKGPLVAYSSREKGLLPLDGPYGPLSTFCNMEVTAVGGLCNGLCAAPFWPQLILGISFPFIDPLLAD